MTVDTKRVDAVFEVASAAADLDERAAILDRECLENADLRRRVEALLKKHDDATRLVERRPSAASAPAPADPTGNVAGPTDPGASGHSQPDEVTSIAGDEQTGDEVSLDFLEPSTKPGSLGRLGHHEVLGVIGRGAFGIVVRAFDEKLQRVVAIKVLSPHLAATSPARKRFLREARASGGVRHENVVQIYAVEELPLPYLVMEYIPGQTLQQRLDQIGPLEAPEVLRIGEQIARGLAAAH